MADEFVIPDDENYSNGYDSGQFDSGFVTPDEEIGSGSWWDVPGGIAKQSIYNVGRAAGGAVSAFEEALGTGTNLGQDTIQKANYLTDELRRSLDFQPGSTKQNVTDIASGLAPAVLALGAAPLAGSAATLGTLGALGAENFGRRYADLRGEGGDPTGSLYGATGSTLFNTALNALPISRAFNPASGLLRKTAEIGATNAATAPFSTALDTKLDIAASGQPLTQEEWLDRLKQSEQTALISAPIFAGLGHATTKFGQRRATKANQASVEDFANKFSQAGLADEGTPPPPTPPGLPAPDGIFGEDFVAKPPTPEQQAISEAMRTQRQEGDFFVPSDVPELPRAVAQEDGVLNIPDILPEQGGLKLETTSARTPEEDTFLRNQLREEQLGIPGKPQMGPATQLFGPDGKPVIADTPAPQDLIKPFNLKGEMRKSLPIDDKQVAQDVLRESRARKEYEKKILPVVVKKPMLDASKLITSKEFPNLLKEAKNKAQSNEEAYYQARAEGLQGREKFEAYRESLVPKYDPNRVEPRPEARILTPEEASAQKLGEKPSFKDKIKSSRLMKNQGGFIKFGDLFSRKSTDDVASDLNIKKGKITEEQWRESENFLSGKTLEGFGGKHKIKSKMGQDATSLYRNLVVFPKTLADKFVEFSPFFEGAQAEQRNTHAVAEGIGKEMAPYAALPDESRQRVANALFGHRIAASKGGQPPVTPEILAKAGLSPDEVAGFMAVRKSMDTAWRVAEQASILKANSIEDPAERAIKIVEIKKNFSDLRAKNYVPLSRFGEHFVQADDVDGKPYFALHESAKAARAEAQKLINRGVDVRVGEMPKPSSNALGLPPDLAAQLSKIDPTTGSALPKGFAAHLENAKYVEGYSKDMDRALADYVTKLARWSASQIAQMEYAKGFKNLQNKGMTADNSDLYRYAQRYVDYQNSSGPEGQAIRNFLAQYYLGFNLKSAAVNLTQTLTTTAPELGKYVGYGRVLPTMKRAYGEAFRYLSNRESYAKMNPERATLIKRAIEDGVVAESVYRDLVGEARGGQVNKLFKGKSLSDVSMFLFDGAEKYNRLTTFIAGLDAAKAQGLKGEAAFRFSEKFVSDTQFDYSKANRPEMARGRLAPLSTFRLFAGNWLRLLRNNLEPGHYKTAAALLGTMVTLGGATAFPFAKIVIQALEASGHDPKKKARELFGNGVVGDSLMNGLPMGLFGVSLSGSIGLGELAPDFEQGPLPAGVRALTGVVADPIQRLFKAEYFLNDLDNPGRAAESLLPEGARFLSRGYRLATEGMKNAKGHPMTLGGETMGPEQFSAKDVLLYSTGFNPALVAKTYEEQHSRDVAEKRATENYNINYKIAKATFEGDLDRVDELRRMAEEEGINISKSEVKKQINLLEGKRAKPPKRAASVVRGIEELYR